MAITTMPTEDIMMYQINAFFKNSHGRMTLPGAGDHTLEEGSRHHAQLSEYFCYPIPAFLCGRPSPTHIFWLFSQGPPPKPEEKTERG